MGAASASAASAAVAVPTAEVGWTATAAAARAAASSASSAAVERAAAKAAAAAATVVGAGGERAQREAESPQQEGQALLRGPDTRNRTSNPDSWVLPGRTTIGGEVHSRRARPRHPIGRRGKLRPSGQPNGGVRPGGPTIDSLICAADLPNSGTAPPMVQPESPAALLTCVGRHTAAHPPAADGPPAYPESGPSLVPGDLRFGCPEPCTRQDNLPEQRSPTSDLWSSTCARCASRPDFGLGGWRPQVQNLGRDRLRPFGRGRGWGKVSRPPHWKRANLATRRARGRQVRRSISQDRTFPWRGDACPRDQLSLRSTLRNESKGNLGSVRPT